MEKSKYNHLHNHQSSSKYNHILNNSNYNMSSICGRNKIYLVPATRGGFGSGGSGIGQNRCPSIENKFTDNPSVNRLLIGSSDRVGWAGLAGGWSSLKNMQVGFFGLFWACKWTLKIQSLSLFLTFFGHFKA